MATTYRSRYEALVRALPEEDQRLLACRIARWALTEHQVEDPRSWEAVEVSRRYADGLATPQELRAAEDAAWDARAAEGAARAAAAAAAWAAAEDAAWAIRAATEADLAAARAAQEARGARDTARTATYKLFFEWALELMIGEKVSV